MSFAVHTSFPLAHKSPDHLSPWGTKNDNNTSEQFIAQVEKYFGDRKLTVMDLGCSGGQFVIDMHRRGHRAIGLEGSDYSVKHARANWPEYHNDLLFTCDICRPYEVTFDGTRQQFDLITAWEVLEHPKPWEVALLLSHARAKLRPGGLLCASVCLVPDHPQGVELHQCVLPRAEWHDLFDACGLVEVIPCPVSSWVRGPYPDGFNLCLTLK